MRFLCFYSKPESVAPPTQQEMEEMGKLIGEAMNEGWLVATEGCLPTALGARVRRSGGKITVTDGPFTESKEVIGGYAIIKADSKAQAIELTKRFLAVAGDGLSEIRQVYEAQQ